MNAKTKHQSTEAYLARRRAHSNQPGIREHKRNRELLKYGLTLKTFNALLAGQGGVCVVCGTSDFSSSPGGHPVVDHDHKTGVVRGLLCSNCNTAIGFLKNSPQIIRAAADYLEGE